MSRDFEDTSHDDRRKGSGDNTVKVLLIIFAAFFGLLFLVCCGGGAWMFYLGKRMVENAAITNPADIQKLTAEITDITIPPEFSPQHGSSLPIANMKMVHYGWCPGGNCGSVNDVSNIDSDNVLMLTSFNIGENDGSAAEYSDFDESMISDDFLKQTWKKYTRTEHTFDIRGKSCTFYIIQGEELSGASSGADDEAMPAQSEPAETSDAAAESTPDSKSAETEADEKASAPSTASPAGTGKRIVQISGSFPGKSGHCTLQIRLSAENYDETMMLEMLKSIR